MLSSRNVSGARSSRIDWRRIATVATAALLVAVAVSWIALSGQVLAEWGNDFDFYVGIAERWQETGALYGAEQLAGPYEAMTGVSMLYPPIYLYLFVPFLVLPGFLYWAIPLGLIACHIVLARPAWWAWPIMALLLFAPRSQAIIIWGNTGMWVAAIVAVGLRHPWASPFVLLKPTLAPFALIGIRHRSWWLGLAALVAVSLPMLPLWFDYLSAMRNNVGDWPPGFIYSIPDYLLVLVPVVAWVARRDGSEFRRVASATFERASVLSSRG